MKTLIIGGGYLGTVLLPHFQKQGEAVLTTSEDMDITNLASVEKVIGGHAPDFIINTAAFTNTNEAELPEKQEEVYAVNVQGPSNIAAVAQKYAIPWVQFSTGMMFDGKNGNTGWSEEDIPQPTNYYSWTKFRADEQLTPVAEKNLIYILRIHTPLSSISHPRNFINRLQKFDKAIDIPSSISIVEDVCTIIDQLLSKKAAGGIYHAVNPDVISAYRIACIMQEAGLIQAEKNITALTREELDAMTKQNGGAHQTFPVLSTKKLEKLGIHLDPAETAVRKTIHAFS